MSIAPLSGGGALQDKGEAVFCREGLESCRVGKGEPDRQGSYVGESYRVAWIEAGSEANAGKVRLVLGG